MKPVTQSKLKPVRDRRQVETLYQPRWKKYLSAIANVAAPSALLVAGTVWTLNQEHPKYTRPAELLKLPGALIQAQTPTQEAFRIGQVLRRYTKNGEVADRIADALVVEGRRKNIDPVLLVGVMLVEDAKLDPRAKSNVGARGLMQVMPFHSGNWGCPSKDLFNIESNICHGVSVLAQTIKKTKNLNRALLAYNGCVKGRNTKNCHTYPSKVLKARGLTESQMLAVTETP
ncbi:MAG TPA: transglycosylase SLT domain-containing protein [Gemmatimonadaceae bacterium]|nr:transglycosylase SLT domain-containing protein [Gemmatimonadaceae bacterium]